MVEITYIKEDSTNSGSYFYDSIRAYKSDSDTSSAGDSDNNNNNNNWKCNNSLYLYKTSTYLGLEDINISSEFLYKLYIIVVIMNWLYAIFLLFNC
jgi:hypothetical protein